MARARGDRGRVSNIAVAPVVYRVRTSRMQKHSSKDDGSLNRILARSPCPNRSGERLKKKKNLQG